MFNRIQRNLHLKITMVILILIFIFAGCISYILYAQSVSSLEREAYGRLSQMVLAYGNELNIDITNTMQITESLASLIKEDFDEEKVKSDPGYLSDQIKRFSPYIQAMAQEFSLAKTAYIYYNWKLDGKAHDIYFVDYNNDGNVTRQEELPISFFEEDISTRGAKNWWYGPIETRKGYWSPPYDWIFDDGSQTKFISYTQAVFHADQLIGVVGTDFKYSNLTDLMDRIKVYDTGFPFLLNEEQVFLIHPQLEGKALDEIALEPYSLLHDQISQSPVGNIAYKAVDGSHWYITYYRLMNNWTLGLASPVSEITASARSITLLLLIILGVAIPIIILASFYSARRMTDPLHELTETVRRIEYGEYNTNIDDTILARQDEIGILALVIRKMGSSLSEKITEIVQKNAQLQDEIEEKTKAKDSFRLVYEAFSAAQNGMIITDADHIIRHANPSFSHLTEFTENPVGIHLELLLQHVCDDPSIHLENSPFSHQKMIISHLNMPKRYLWLVLTRIENKDGEYQYIGVLEDQTETIHQAQSIDYLKEHDAITGLLNKPAALVHIHSYVNSHMQDLEIAALITINIDDFRMINEAMGYDCGDAVILEMAARFKSLLKMSHVLARATGDEFIIFIKDLSYLQEIEVLGQKILSLASQSIHWKGRDLFITLSVGISIYPFDTDDPDQLFSRSVAALNNAKANGKNNLKFYSQEMAELSFEKYELSNQLREALDKNEFFLLYQPIIEMPQRTIHGAEALIRWLHPTKGIISPDRFIPLAEANGTIEAIGEWVIDEVCRQIKAWESENFNINQVSINLSTLQLNHLLFAEKAHNILSIHDISTSQINMEITESALVLQNSIASHNLEQLKDLAFEIHIDDFGTGFSSLAYLRDFKIDVLKIDRSFVKGIPNLDNGDLARLIIDLSHSLGIHTIAEGVETIEQLDYLYQHGCKYIQGYYFSKPLKPEDLKNFKPK